MSTEEKIIPQNASESVTRRRNKADFTWDEPSPLTTFGKCVALRTYARRLDDSDPNSDVESFREIIERVVVNCQKQLGCGFTSAEQTEFFRLMMNLKCIVAGRALWQLGSATIDKEGMSSLQNCAFITVGNSKEPHKIFEQIFDNLMLGTGQGVNIMPENVYSLPKIHEVKEFRRNDIKDAHHIVADSRQGWTRLLGKLLKFAFFGGPDEFTYSCQLVRGKGAPIKTFGGVASGPESLEKGINLIREIINKRAGLKLRPIDALDIIDIIGMVVVSGNVRRSAIIVIGDCHDREYVQAKEWELHPVPAWRYNSNNSVVCSDTKELPDHFWDTYKSSGEPIGLINLDLMRKCGRIGDTQYPDPHVEGTNPCAEQSLESGETCCLAEIFLPNIKSEDEFKTCARYVYRVNKHILALKCNWKNTENIVHKNMRMGISVTGVAQATKEQLSWLSPVYEYLREYDVKYSKQHGFPPSIKLTTVKPSGTLSCVGGTTPGIHAAYSQQYIRRVRFSANHPLVPILEAHGYKSEFVERPDPETGAPSHDFDTKIIEFVQQWPKGTKTADKMTAIEQLEMVKFMQTQWSDNCISSTITYKPSELNDIKAWLAENYKENIKSVSFLLYSDHKFRQAPYEPITKKQYDEIVKKHKPLKIERFSDFQESEELVGALACIKGACPVR